MPIVKIEKKKPVIKRKKKAKTKLNLNHLTLKEVAQQIANKIIMP